MQFQGKAMRPLVIITSAALMQACGSSNSSDDSISAAVPTKLAISSVTAAKVDSSGSSLIAGDSESASRVGPSGPRTSRFKELSKGLGDRVAKGEVADCLSGLSLTLREHEEIECYGPAIGVKNHPDAPEASPSEVPLPPGDLGLWASTTEETGEACSATKANSLVDASGSLINESLAILAGMVCVAKAQGEEPTAVGDEADVKKAMNRLLPNTKLDTAKVSLKSEDSSAGTKTYETSFEGLMLGVPMNVTLTHTTDEDGDTVSGRLAGNHGGNDKPGDGKVRPTGFSVVYSQSGTSLSYILKSGQADSLGADYADDSGDFDFSGEWTHNANYLLASIDTDTGLGTLYYAWQAGKDDQNTRVLQATASDSSGSETAVAYFGYGPDIAESDVGSIDGMICNWAGPGAGAFGSKTIQEGKAQAQVMARSGDYFTPSADYIQYAPTLSCDNSSADFAYNTEKDGDWTEFGEITNELATYGDSAIGTIPELTAPTY